MRTLLRASAVAMLALIATATLPTTPAGAAISAAHATTRPAAASRPRVRNVLIISLPTVTWDDVQSQPMPALRRLLHDSAVADLSTRTVRVRTDAANGYAALGAGARAVADADLAGQNLGAHEPYGDSSAGQVFTRPTGRRVVGGVYSRRAGLRLFGGVGALGIASIRADNEAQPFDTIPGALGTALRKA